MALANDLTNDSCVLVIPCYNEAARLDEATYVAFLEQHPETHLCFVDDGSHDNTRVVLEQIAARAGRHASVLPLEENRGKAEAVRRGMCQAMDRGAGVAGYWDADLATPLAAAHTLWAELRARPGLDLAMGSRVNLLGRSIRRSAARHYLNRCGVTLVNAVLGLVVYDSQCGAKLFRVNATVRRVFDEPFCSRWLFDIELLLRLAAAHGQSRGELGAHVREVPLETWHSQPGSKIKPYHYLTAARDVLTIARHYRSWQPPHTTT